jgi:hypothetical protein
LAANQGQKKQPKQSTIYSGLAAIPKIMLAPGLRQKNQDTLFLDVVHVESFRRDPQVNT